MVSLLVTTKGELCRRTLNRLHRPENQGPHGPHWLFFVQLQGCDVTHDQIDRIEVRWLGADVEQFTGVEVDRVVTLVEVGVAAP